MSVLYIVIVVVVLAIGIGFFAYEQKTSRTQRVADGTIGRNRTAFRASLYGVLAVLLIVFVVLLLVRH